jgi:hypothetical protein
MLARLGVVQNVVQTTNPAKEAKYAVNARSGGSADYLGRLLYASL